jgi:hypothetical protein
LGGHADLPSAQTPENQWSFTMRFIGFVTLALACCLGSPAAMAQQKPSAPAGAAAERQPPAGHRQPQAKDAPPDRTGEDTVKPEDRAMEKALKGICRGC